jgi:hypothetical protein
MFLGNTLDFSAIFDGKVCGIDIIKYIYLNTMWDKGCLPKLKQSSLYLSHITHKTYNYHASHTKKLRLFSPGLKITMRREIKHKILI